MNDDEPLGLPWQTSLAFIRISTSPRAVRRPLQAEEACSIISALLERPSVLVVEPGEQFWQTFKGMIAEGRIAGPLVTDASLAALAAEHGAAVCSTDRDFRRFKGLSVIDPTEGA